MKKYQPIIQLVFLFLFTNSHSQFNYISKDIAINRNYYEVVKEYLLDMQKYPSVNYLYSLKCGGVIIGNGKVSIQK